MFLLAGVWAYHSAAVIQAEELSRPVELEPGGEVNEQVLAYQNMGQFQGNIYVTKNFRVQAASPQLAQAVGDRAEGYRELLSNQWLGYKLPDWSHSCPIEVTVSNQAHGETSFLLSENGVDLPSDWEMKVFGPTDRLLDSVLPHEVTHTIFASHFKQRLPRWADEGACTTIEHPSEREKIHALLLRYLSPQYRQGIPFNRMFPMRDYPSDMLPLYAQGYSVAKFLIAQGGHRQFVQLMERGLQNERNLPVTVAWDQAMRETYGYEDLSELQLDWLKWVGEGSQESSAVARLEQRMDTRLASLETPDTDFEPARPVGEATAKLESDENFYVQQMRTGLSKDASAAPEQTPDSALPIRASGNLLPIQKTSASLGAPDQGKSNYRSDSTILLPPRLR
ncbi:MAG: hypothetical protein JNL67_18530 [Planctomycetaceae bacterium]|nr:hypothetical protein [Planctomycetaceae bacterium]